MASAICVKHGKANGQSLPAPAPASVEAIAVELQSGVNLVLTARRRERLDLLAERLRSKYSIQTQVIVADLTLPQSPQQIFDATEGAGQQ